MFFRSDGKKSLVYTYMLVRMCVCLQMHMCLKLQKHLETLKGFKAKNIVSTAVDLVMGPLTVGEGLGKTSTMKPESKGKTKSFHKTVCTGVDQTRPDNVPNAGRIDYFIYHRTQDSLLLYRISNIKTLDQKIVSSPLILSCGIWYFYFESAFAKLSISLYGCVSVSVCVCMYEL